MKPKRRRRALVAVLAAGLAVSVGWALNEQRQRALLEAQLDARYQQRFFDALGNVERVEVLLSKSTAAASAPMLTRLMAELWQEAFAGQANLSQLPILSGALLRTNQFLAQVGDYGFRRALAASSGRPLSDEQQGVLERLREEAAELAEALQAVSAQAGGSMPWKEEWGGRTRRTLQEEDPPGSRMMMVEDRMETFPSLVYDGPYSDHVLERRPAEADRAEVGEEEAEKAARSFLPEGASAEVRRVRAAGASSPVAAYGFEFRTQEEGGVATLTRLDVARRGGEVLWMLKNRPPKPIQISESEAAEAGEKFLEERGIGPVESLPAARSGSRLIVPYVPMQEGVLLYPDQIRLTIDLGDGAIVGYDAVAYYMAHRERELPSPSFDPQEAERFVHPQLTVERVRLALIPLEDLSERLAYEVRARRGDRRYLIFIDAQSGEELQLLLEIRSEEDGSLYL